MSQTAYAIFLVLDQSAQAVWKNIIAQTGFVTVWPAHVTLMSFETLPDDYIGRLQRLAKDQNSLFLTFESIARFVNSHDVYFLAPTPTMALLRLQKSAYDIFLVCAPKDYCHPNGWMPHCSIAIPGEWEKVSEFIKSPPAIFNCHAHEIWLIDIVNKKLIHQLFLEPESCARN